jgi:hypothetical protein
MRGHRKRPIGHFGVARWGRPEAPPARKAPLAPTCTDGSDGVGSWPGRSSQSVYMATTEICITSLHMPASSDLGGWCSERTRSTAATRCVTSVKMSSSDAMDVRPGLRAAPSCRSRRGGRRRQASGVRRQAQASGAAPACRAAHRIYSPNGWSSHGGEAGPAWRR